MYCAWFGSWIKESLLNEMQFHHLNESYDSCESARPGPPLRDAVSPLERVVRLVRICQARTSFNEMQFHHLNESYDSYEFGRPGPPLMRCSFTKSNVMLFSLKVSHSPLGSYDWYES